MAIILVPQPGSAPSSLAEWVNSVESLKQYNLGVNSPVDYNFDGDTIKKGVLITIGGSNYYCSADTAISGTASDYVQVTSAGVASYVTDLTGVSWNDTYNFYADVTGNAYIFNEAKAVYDESVTDPKSIIGKLSLMGYFETLNISKDLLISKGGGYAGRIGNFGVSNFESYIIPYVGGIMEFRNTVTVGSINFYKGTSLQLKIDSSGLNTGSTGNKIGSYGVSSFEGYITPYSAGAWTEIVNTVETRGIKFKTSIGDTAIITNSLATFNTPIAIIDGNHTTDAYLDFLRGSSGYGSDIYTDYRLQNDAGTFKLKSNESVGGEVTLISVVSTEMTFHKQAIFSGAIKVGAAGSAITSITWVA